MAWKQVKVLEQRKKLILAITSGVSITSACRQFDISRPTAYEWLKRFHQEGTDGLLNRSSAPNVSPNAIPEEIEKAILQMKLRFLKFGPRKVLAKLIEEYPVDKWPCATSIGNIFTKNGLTVKRKVRKAVYANVPAIFKGNQPNEVWSMDFKGSLKTFDKCSGSPFTVTDSCTRFLIRCNILKNNNLSHVWGILDAAFREFGLPQYILSDNGPPFASLGVGRLSRLSVNLIRAGVKPLWIEPGKPQQNGRHERMHGAMEYELGNPAAKSIAELKKKLLYFQKEYNFDRPHEALGQIPPGRIYVPSDRNWNGIFQSPEYEDRYEVRKVQKDGTINRKGNRIFIGEALYHEPVGIINESNELKVFYGDQFLGVIKDQRVEFKKLC